MKIALLGGSHAGKLGLVDTTGGTVSVLSEDMTLARLADGETPLPVAEIPVQDASLAAPLMPGARVLCVGLNFYDHAKEAGMAVPELPSIFPRFRSSFSAPDEAIIAPSISAQFDYEVELTVVIGRAGRHIAEADAAKHILGYTCLADNSVRDWQKHSRQATPGKNFDRSGAIGPWISTTDEMPPLAEIALETFVNGVRRQHGSGGDLIFSPDYCVSYISNFMELRPGDMIALGTPAGVASGEAEPNWLKPGDQVELRISGIGSLRNAVQAEQ
ncbi:fumarylacetoacetate hydrolase family protein [Salipiger abyssi]|uniref:fumarylacetoacetate hydrolase family protein n=1 Tax=Salipiger abyssi TaxID=1250539 RepID=UPI001A8E94CC|nr:fumarylacetoacetate hydrolase family protein [Salipiger abyssi]MBN9888891.1 fumarylacetoacetate hydrolase family protein [Salipiger abyssi]